MMAIPVPPRWLLVVLILFATQHVAAQTTGKISGRIVDVMDGQPLPGVNVLLNETMQGASTDVDGDYFIINIRPGTYAVRASFIGYTPVVVQNVQVSIGQTTLVDFKLKEEVIQGEEIVIVAEKPIVQHDLTSSSVSISASQLATLPVLNFSDVVALQAGVVEGHFRGGRAGEVSYLVDGIPINDVFNQSFAYEVQNNAIQEVNIISGTFNAEFGQAQSGVVNIVTKEGGNRLEATGNFYFGDYMSSDTELFGNLNDVTPSGIYDLEGTLGGPVPFLGKRVHFFSSARLFKNDGFLYGRNIVNPAGTNADTGQLVQVDGREVFVPSLGDSSWSSMNWSELATVQLKLTARIFGTGKLSINGLVQDTDGQDFDHLFRYNPGGLLRNSALSKSLTFNYTHLLGTASFLEFKGAYFENEVDRFLYSDPLDDRYPNDNALRQLAGNFSFFRGGASMTHTSRKTTSLVAKLDLISQITKNHQIKSGYEYKGHELFLDDFEVKNNSGTDFKAAIPPAGTPDHVLYTRKPFEMGAYIQDKMEFGIMTVNLGVRWDYFDANSEVLEDFGRPRTSPRMASTPKSQLSPRIGLAYPLSEQGVVHVSYGHFFQMPPFEFLFTNPDYIFDPEEGLNRAFGYPDLEPQRTIAYEIGLTQALSSDVKIEGTTYFRDIRNLLGTRIEVISAGFDEFFQLSKYGRFINRDFGQVKGLILSFEKRLSHGYGIQIDYTFQVAEGNASDPRSVLLDEQAGIESEKQLVALDWDRRHQLNTTFTLGTPGKWIATVIGKLGSGLPYTPSLADERISIENSGRRRGTVTFDLFARKTFDANGWRFSVIARIFNLFDTRNEVNVYTDTGRTFPNLQFLPGQPQGLNTKEQFITRPDFFSPPRQITLGLSFSF
ncbi:MAG: TonB-dependent receptor [Bacteroidetes bacterium]|nr:MAG: TonB-dependent receptor [Bacteroidota bacterium]